MKINYLTAICATTMGAAMSSCFDDNYDLSDIDTTIQVGVTELVVPINLDQIELKNIFEIKEGDDIQVNANGDYEYHCNGTFDTKGISVNPVFVAKPDINSSDATMALGDIVGGTARAAAAYIPYTIASPVSESMDLTSANIDKSILDLTEIYTNAVLTVSVPLSNFKAISQEIDVHDFVLQLPANMDAAEKNGKGEYDPATGKFEIDDLTFSTSGDMEISLNIAKIAFKNGEFDPDSHTMHIAETIGILEGTFGIPLRDDIDINALPQTIGIKVNYDMASEDNPAGFDAFAMSGEIQYMIEDFDIAAIDITSLPDVLSQEGTNLVFANPQIYLNINNPLQQYGVYAHLGIDIDAFRGDKISNYVLPGGITIGKDPVRNSGIYNFCLSPKDEGLHNAEFPDLIHVAYPELANVLSGDGIPETLKINILNPQMPAQPVTKFELKAYDKIEGHYQMIAPLQLGAGSKICYADTVDGWNDDLDKLTIQKLRVDCNITSDIPVNIDFTGYPIDKYGKQINNVEIQGAKVPANANNAPLTISISGSIKDLDGIIFKATATSDDDSKPLNKNMKIQLSNIRPCVTGYYTDEL